MREEIQQLFSLPPKGPFNNILVLEIGGNVSGPKAGSELAHKGALVIKIEQSSGDQARTYLPSDGDKPNPIFTSLNAGKASIILGPHDELIYNGLLALADVIIDNRSPDAKQRDKVFQVFLKDPKKKHPVIFCSIVGYDSQANHHRPALDVAVQAESGMAAVNAPYPHLPLKVGFVLIDTTTGIQAASEIKDHLLALKLGCVIPEQDNHVITIEVSMAKVAATLLAGQYLMCKTLDKEPARVENRDLFIAPFSFYTAKDGMVSLAVIGGKDDAKFIQFCEKVLEDKAFAKQYPSNQFRLEHNVAFEAALNAKLSQRDAEEWIKRCTQHGFVCTKVNTVKEALAQPFAQALFTKTKDGTTVIADPALSSLFGSQTLNGAPRLNEHQIPIQWLLSYEMENGAADFRSLTQMFQQDALVSPPIVRAFEESMKKEPQGSTQVKEQPPVTCARL